LKSLFDALRRELETESIIPLSYNDWEEITREIRKFAMHCSEAINREACDARLEVYKKLFKDLIKYRVYKAIKYEGVPEESVDSPFLKVIVNLIDSMVKTLDEVIADERGNVLVIVKRKIEVKGVVVEPGEAVLMNFIEAVTLDAFGYVEMLRIPVEGSKEYQWFKTSRLRESPQ